MARKSGNKKDEVEVSKHDDARKNAVPIGLASYDVSKPKLKKYENDSHLAFLTNTRSFPFKSGTEKRIAVKVIDHRGNEVMVVREVV
ncbi:MAG: hypothetical protein FJ266_06550 [Planctomycetes bacterium]|nr:hypothetical protein [Planctomycetota bacterium]